MKKLKLILAALCICLLLVPMTVQAREVTSEFFTVDLDVGHHDNIGPGDTFTETFSIENTSKTKIDVRVYDVDNKENSKLYPVLEAGWANEGTAVKFDSFDKLKTDWFSIDPGETADLKLDIHFPIDCGNEYQGTTLEARFIFEARIPDRAVGNYGPDSDSPQTGDSFNPMFWGILATASGCMLLIVLWTKKRKRDR